jgi:hypothetical protein
VSLAQASTAHPATSHDGDYLDHSHLQAPLSAAQLLDAVDRVQRAHSPRQGAEVTGAAPGPTLYVQNGSVDPVNDFVDVAAGVLNSRMQRRHGMDVARLPMVPWTRAPPVLDGGWWVATWLDGWGLGSVDGPGMELGSLGIRYGCGAGTVLGGGGKRQLEICPLPLQYRSWHGPSQFIPGTPSVRGGGRGGHPHPPHHGPCGLSAAGVQCGVADGQGSTPVGLAPLVPARGAASLSSHASGA